MVVHRLILAMALAAGLPGQTVWTTDVPNFGWTVQQAAPGDVVLIQQANSDPLPPFLLTKGLILIATPPRGVWEPNPSATTPHDSTIAIPAGQRARIVGLSFQRSPVSGGGQSGHRVTVSGEVAFESCSFRGRIPSVLVTGGNVLMNGCIGGTILGEGGIEVAGGHLAITNSTFAGGSATFNSLGFGIPAVSALTVGSATVHAASCTFVGGNGAFSPFGPLAPAPAIRMTGGQMWLVDATVNGGNAVGGSPGAIGVVVPASGAVLEHARCNIAGGSGAPPGPATSGNTVVVPELVGIRIDHDLVRGQSTIVTATTGSSQLIVIGASFAAALSSFPLIVEPVHGQVLSLIPLLLDVSPGATVNTVVPVPATPSLLGAEVWFQAFQFSGAVVRASPGVGGVVR